MFAKNCKGIPLILCLTVLVSACSNKGDWPTLVDKVPDAQERDRVIERVTPSVDERIAPDAEIHSREEALQLMKDIMLAIEAEQKTYLIAKKEYENTVSNEKNSIWFGLQLALTRLSHSNSRLDSLIYSKNTAANDVKKEARIIKTSMDKFVIEERKALSVLKPE